MTSPLDRLVGDLLSLEPFDLHEYEGLMASGLARMNDARRKELSLTSRFDLAYNAGHAFCLAALRRRGFRPGKRYVVFQVLPHTLGLGPEVWRVLDRAHTLRNRGEYDGYFDVDDRLVEDLIGACHRVAETLDALGAPA